MLNSPLLPTFILFAFGAVQFAVAGFIAWQRRLNEWPERLLALYAIVLGLWEWIQGLSPWVTPLQTGSLVWLSGYVLLLLTLLFFWMTQAFLRLGGRGWAWGLVALGGGVLLTLLWGPWLPLPINHLTQAPLVGLGLAALAAIIYVGLSAKYTYESYKQASQPLHRNRIIYWSSAIVLIVIAALTFFVGGPVVGGLLHLLSTGGLTYIVINHRLPDLRQNSRKTLTYVAIGFASALIYVLVIAVLEFGLRTTLGYNEWATLGLTFLFVALLLHPLIQLLQQITLRRVMGIAYDSAEAVRDYSASISNILNIERLAVKVTALISEAMGTPEVHLLLIDHLKTEGKVTYRLQTVPGTEQAKPVSELLSTDNPVAMYLAMNDRPLAQYDIDLLPRYRKMPETEREWLTALHIDVYVPIHTRGQWIGLLTLGPKLTKDRYFDSDMTLLNTLADQTAIALENARLVSSLIGLNSELKQAFADLERAHHQLNELDRLKSAFIGAITHELRTPIANIQFSIQLIEKYGVEKMSPDQQQQFYQLINEARHAKTMVDNLVNFATFLGKQGDLKLAELSFSEVLGETVVMLEPLARRKDLTLRSDVADEGLPPVQGDRARLGDAVYHLIQNAIKFTGPEGIVTARCWAKDGSLFFEVTDTGLGVPPDKIDSLWEGFTQMADPLKRGLEGLGLGLALVKYVVKAHDGETIARSTGVPGEGSTFGFHIPLAGPKPHTTFSDAELAQIATPVDGQDDESAAQ